MLTSPPPGPRPLPAAVPAAILFVGSIILPETPNSLIERGHRAKGRAVLARLRATEDVDAEFEDICAAADEANRVSTVGSWKALFSRECSPMLIVTSLIAMLQQLTGINAIMVSPWPLLEPVGMGAGRQAFGFALAGRGA